MKGLVFPMYESCKIVLVGGGSANWSPTIIHDMLVTKGLENARYTILEIDEAAGEKMARYGNMAAGQLGVASRFDCTLDQTLAFTGADFVIITISTGDLAAMEHDLVIPEKYRIYQSVGDSVGPGGCVRGLRNIPVFAAMARKIEELAPNAVILNYSNPMSTLTKVFSEVSGLRTVGLCHGLFEVYESLIKAFKLDGEQDIQVNFGGVNHFFWITELAIRGQDGFAMLREELKHKSFTDIFEEEVIDNMGYQSQKWVAGEQFTELGYLPYIGDRHISEFFSRYLAGNGENLRKYHLKRTSVKDRHEIRERHRAKLDRMLAGTEPLPKRSREIAADIIQAFVRGETIIDVVNLPNKGQIANLPEGAVVETLGTVNRLGFTPLTVGKLPRQVESLVLPHCVNQGMIVEAGLTGNLELALTALYNDPLCSHLNLAEIKEMGIKLLEANREYLPQFFESPSLYTC
jgi:alpha-galactosidase